jgi:hypothetical protein
LVIDVSASILELMKSVPAVPSPGCKASENPSLVGELRLEMLLRNGSSLQANSRSTGLDRERLLGSHDEKALRLFKLFLRHERPDWLKLGYPTNRALRTIFDVFDLETLEFGRKCA